MINANKTINLNEHLQIPGMLPGDNNVEFVGIKQSLTVFWFQNGCSHYFTDLPLRYFKLLKAAYLKDHKAQSFLKNVTTDVHRQIELFTYYNWGALDGTPDIKNGVLQPCENFRHVENCPSLLWDSKYINIGPYVLTPKQLVIIDLIAKGLPDKSISASLNISIRTLDNHKQKLYKSLGVHSKSELVGLAYKHKIVA